jgi:hypothetical protein
MPLNGEITALEMRVRLATRSSRPGISAQPPARNSWSTRV